MGTRRVAALQVHGSKISVLVNHGDGGVDPLEIDLVSDRAADVSRRLLAAASGIEKKGGVRYSSSIVSCGGSGSSRPRPMISQVKLLSTLSMFTLKLKSSRGCCGESLKFQRSTSRLLAMLMDGSVTLKLALAAACSLARPGPLAMGRPLATSGLAAAVGMAEGRRGGGLGSRRRRGLLGLQERLDLFCAVLDRQHGRRGGPTQGWTYSIAPRAP